MPVAVNCWVIPTGMLGLADVTAMEDRGGAFTLRIVLPNELWLEKLLGSLEVAVMVVVPNAMAVTRPLLSTVATDGSEELQVTRVVMSWVVWSL